jgi:hypothetical protein
MRTHEKGRFISALFIHPAGKAPASAYSSGTIKSATMLMILMSGFTAGPAVSL